MKYDPKRHPPQEGSGNCKNSILIENSGNSKNHINFHSLSKSRGESVVKADADQNQDQRIDF